MIPPDQDTEMSDHLVGVVPAVKTEEPATINPSVFAAGHHGHVTDSNTDFPPSIIVNPESPTLMSRSLIMTPPSPRLQISGPVVEIEELTQKGKEIRREALTPMNRPKPLPNASLPTGLCFDIRMRFHAEIKPTSEIHPEEPRRITHIYNELCQAGLVGDPSVKCPPAGNLPLGGEILYRIDARDATYDEVSLVHTGTHYDFIESTRLMVEDDLLELVHQHDSMYFNNLSFLASILAAGGAIETCRAVVNGTVKNAIAVIRPPGHHAEMDRAMGFCCFNNVSIAARVCQREFGDKCRKVLILDWDVHHGNGIQNIFYDDPNVLYISLHVYNGGNFYPHGTEGGPRMCGNGAGLGKNVNIPWPSQGMGDGDYMYAFQNIVMPIAYEFDPDLVIIAAGFDAAAGDELGGCFVTPACYAHMTRMLMTLAKGKLAVCLEGGYNLKSISKSALAVTRTLLGEPPDRMEPPIACKPAIDAVHEVARVQSKYWRCMYTADIDITAKDKLGGERMHDIIRTYQSRLLYDKYKMISLFILRDELSVSFQNQVVATPNYHLKNPLLVIFHDPPEILGVPNPSTAKLELHNTWLTDVVKHYIDWAIKQGFGVIDVNIPKHLTGLDDEPGGYVDEDRTRRLKATEQLAVYLWENYIEINDSTEIFFMGIGDAYQGLLHILTAREQSRDRVTGVINILSENPLRPVTSQTDDYAGTWYHRNSLVFVAKDHNVWSPERRAPKKKFGKLVKSPQNGLNEMLHAHQQEIQQFILDRVIIEEESEEDELGEEKTGTAAAGALVERPPKGGDVVMTTGETEHVQTPSAVPILIPTVDVVNADAAADANAGAGAAALTEKSVPLATRLASGPSGSSDPASSTPTLATATNVSTSAGNNNGAKRKRRESQEPNPITTSPLVTSPGTAIRRRTVGAGNGNGNGNAENSTNPPNTKTRAPSKSPLSTSTTATAATPATPVPTSRSASSTPKISSLLNPAPEPGPRQHQSQDFDEMQL